MNKLAYSGNGFSTSREGQQEFHIYVTDGKGEQSEVKIPDVDLIRLAGHATQYLMRQNPSYKQEEIPY